MYINVLHHCATILDIFSYMHIQTKVTVSLSRQALRRFPWTPIHGHTKIMIMSPRQPFVLLTRIDACQTSLTRGIKKHYIDWIHVLYIYIHIVHVYFKLNTLTHHVDEKIWKINGNGKKKSWSEEQQLMSYGTYIHNTISCTYLVQL